MSESVDKQAIIKNFAVNDKDTGSCEVQVALLSARIAHLTTHLRSNKKDFHSRRGLLLMTSRRRRLLDYLKANKPEAYNKLVADLKLRR